VNNKIFFPTGAFFPIRRKFSDSVKFSICGWGGQLPYKLTPCHDAIVSWRGMF